MISSSYVLSKLESDFAGTQQVNYRLKNAIDSVSKSNLPDYIIIDCPPAINLLTNSALLCSKYILVPFQCEYYVLEGLSQLINSVRLGKLEDDLDSLLNLLGVVFTEYSKRMKLTIQVESEAKRYLKYKVFNVTIPRTVRMSEVPSFGKTILYFDKYS